jgi:Na+-transporting NADH:ubiquinone oxidoreductase subunit NqrC
MLRNAHQQRLQKVREVSFNLAQRANDVLLPSYNALRDPFLSGYFDNPQVKRHLRETGVIKKKRRLSVKIGRGSPETKSHHALTERAGGGLRGKSLVKSVNYLENQVKLPAL